MNRIRKVVFAIGFWLPLLTSQVSAAFQEPDLDAVIKRADQTREKLRNNVAAWVTTIELESGVRVNVECIQAGDQRRFEFKTYLRGQSTKLATIIEREDFWYVESASGRFKTQPYQALLTPASLYTFLAQTELKFVTDEVGEESLGSFVEVSGGRAVYEQTLPEAVQTNIERWLAQVDELLQKRPDNKESILIQRQKLTAILNSKIQVKLDLEHGFIAQDGTTGKRVWVNEFTWLDQDSTRFFNVDNKEWTDLSSPLHVDESTIEFGFDPHYSPEKKSDDISQVLLNSKTGEIRRVPYQYGISSKGCFSKDREKIYAPGFLPDLGGFGLFEIDLQTQAHRQIGSTELSGSFLFGPQLSPDGRQLVVQKIVVGTLTSQIYVIDIATGTTKAIGEPFDTSFVSWHPNGNRLILVRRTTIDINSPPKATVCEMNMSGKRNDIIDGNHPVVLRGISKIMFENQDEDAWYICDLDGQNPTKIGDGLKDFGFPASSPDGSKVVMVNFKHHDGPKPVIVNVASGKIQELDVPKGLWTMPNWQ